MHYRFLIIVVLFFAAAAYGAVALPQAAEGPGRAVLAQSGAAAMASGAPANSLDIDLARDPAGAMIRPGFLGMNILYWIDNDDAWRTKGVPDRLRELGIKTLRYPGGEVADNYDWETNSIERKDRFPFEAKTEEERSGRLDYLEFLQHARNIGVENIFFVVNLEGAFFQPGDRDAAIARYADKAARWVAAVRKAGYTVRYWEIGNESYLNSAYPLTAQEYARALKVFARKMRAADPTIRIGAIGPVGAAGQDAQGFADSLGALGAQRLQERALKGEDPCKRASKPVCAAELGVPFAKNSGPGWWDVLLREAPESFDFAVIHRYRSERMNTGDRSGPLALREQIRDLKDYLRSRKGQIELALTEWNVPGGSPDRLTEQEHLVDIAEQLGNYLEGGVDMALYWPLRMSRGRFSIMSETSYRVHGIYLAFDMFQRYLRRELLTAKYDVRQGVYVIATQDADGKSVVMVNYSVIPKRLNVSGASSGHPLRLQKQSIIGENGSVVVEKPDLRDIADSSRTLSVELPPLSVTGVHIIQQ